MINKRRKTLVFIVHSTVLCCLGACSTTVLVLVLKYGTYWPVVKSNHLFKPTHHTVLVLRNKPRATVYLLSEAGKLQVTNYH